MDYRSRKWSKLSLRRSSRLQPGKKPPDDRRGPTPAPRPGDERLVQVLLNLVGNAIKFTDKGEVAIKATVADGSQSCRV